MTILSIFQQQSIRLLVQNVFSLVAVFCVCLCVAAVPAQTPAGPVETEQSAAERVELLRGLIHTAETQHAGPEKTGTIWLQLANHHYNRMELPQAEDAFAHAVSLLRGTTAHARYADALEGMGSLYLALGRLNDSEECLRKSQKIYEELGDREHEAELHETMAELNITRRRYREAEAESAEGLADLQALAQPDPDEMVVAYLAHSNALCGMGRCAEALADANRAISAIQATHSADPLGLTAAYMTRGSDEWKSGEVSSGERDIQEALRVVRGPTALPRPAVMRAELGEMREYASLLKASHRKPEAKQVETEIGKLQAEQPAACTGCTVSVAVLGFMH